MNFIPITTEIFSKGQNLFEFFCASLEKNSLYLSENSVCIVSSKLVALGQGRVEALHTTPLHNFFSLVKKESDTLFSSRNSEEEKFFLTKKYGIIIPNAGIDSSNSPHGEYILWPENPWEEVKKFREKIQEKFSLKNIGVIVSDSRITPHRRGTVGVALSWSGIFGVQDFRGEKDIFGNILEVSTANTADNLVSGAEILMGQGAEKIPFVVCEHLPEKIFTDIQQEQSDSEILEEEDLFCIKKRG